METFLIIALTLFFVWLIRLAIDKDQFNKGICPYCKKGVWYATKKNWLGQTTWECTCCKNTFTDSGLSNL